jgi:dual specificity phosphatase 12
MDISRIDRHLFQGSALSGPRDVASLRSLGIRAAVDMRAEANTVLPLESLLWIPTMDGEPATVDQLITGIRFIDHCISLGWGVYVYCQGGIGRSTMMVVAYLLGRRGLDAEGALDFIRRRRPGANPSPTQMEAAEKAGLAFRLRYPP